MPRKALPLGVGVRRLQVLLGGDEGPVTVFIPLTAEVPMVVAYA